MFIINSSHSPFNDQAVDFLFCYILGLNRVFCIKTACYVLFPQAAYTLSNKNFLVKKTNCFQSTVQLLKQAVNPLSKIMARQTGIQ